MNLQTQIEVVLPYLDRTPQWLILGGPANCNEAQHTRSLWPGIKVIGVEPNDRAVAWQRENGWPVDGILLNLALAEEAGHPIVGRSVQDRLDMCCLRDSDLFNREDQGDSLFWTMTTTLDDLNGRYGPFQDSILWLDIEEYEVRALDGASELLAQRPPLVINVEVRPKYEVALDTILTRNGYDVAFDWNINSTYRDRIYRRKS